MKREIDIQQLARDSVRTMSPYSSARDDFHGDALVFLDANENPFPTSLNRYPDPHQWELKKEVSKIKGIPPENIFLGNGSDEVIDLIYRTFCETGKDNVVIPQPTYGMYAVSAAINNVDVISVRLGKTFNLEAQEILNKISSQTKAMFFCSPNNPTGNLLDRAAIELLISEFRGLIVVDEAYIDFAESPSWTESLKSFKNLVVLQTLSKAWGLAGLRLGMCFAHCEIIELMNKIKPPYNIGTMSQQHALHVLRNDSAKIENLTRTIREERYRLVNQLKEIKIIETVFPSNANFILVKVDDARKMYDHLLSRRIVVRDRSSAPGCEGCLRITVGTREENVKLIEAIKML